jgi:hypothetical protein
MADPLTEPLLHRLVAASGGAGPTLQRQGDASAGPNEGCVARAGPATTTCQLELLTPNGLPAATLAFGVPLADVERARSDAQRRCGSSVAWYSRRELWRPGCWRARSLDHSRD